MKIWSGYGSEHSANLVMIGHFESVGEAAETHQTIKQLAEQVDADVQAGLTEVGGRADHFTSGMLDLLGKLKVYSLGPAEVEQFVYDVAVDLEGGQVVIKTDETDVSAFLKVLIEKGARVEVYSAHDYPGTGYGRGK